MNFRLPHLPETLSLPSLIRKLNLWGGVLPSVNNPPITSGGAQRFLSLLTKGVEDATFLLISDSTGTSTYWSPNFFAQLAAQFPAYTVTLRYWNNTTFVYDAPTTIQTGSGAQTLAIYNCSISGANTATFLDQYFEDRIPEVRPDFAMISLGHNENPEAERWGPQYLELLTSVIQGCPEAGLCLIAQNPASADTNQELRANVYAEFAAVYGAGFIDVCQVFNENGGAAALTTDGIHPNVAGSSLWANTVAQAFQYTDAGEVRTGPIPYPNTQELLTNGDFSRFAGAVPDGWAIGGGATITKDLVNFEAPHDYAVNIQAVGAVAGYLVQVIPPERVRGRWVTVIARVYKSTSTPTSAGLIGLYDGVGTTTRSRISFVFGAFRWVVWQQYLDPAATGCSVLLYGDQSTTNGNATFDRVSCKIGRVPMIGVYNGAVPAAQVQAGTFGPGDFRFGTNTGTSLNVDFNGAAGSARSLRWLTAAVVRWVLQATATAESGSNAGSNLNLIAFTDAGAVVDTPISVTRAAGGAIILSRRLRTPYGVTFPESADRGDTSQTLTVGTDDPSQLWGTALTANRTISTSTTGAVDGDTWFIRRTGGGAFTLNVGGLLFLGVNQWCTIRYNGSAFVLVGWGWLTEAASLTSPAFTGTPTAPTAAPGTNTTQIATTAFVATSFAPLASPALTGDPTAPTATANDNDTSIATTAYVDRATTHTGTTSAAPTGTTSATAVMMGLAGSITPTRGTKIIVIISGQMANDTVNDGATVDARFGTGTAPTNGAAVTGTLVGIAQTHTSLTATERTGFCLVGKVTGLSVGTAYWLDLSLLAVTGGTASVTGVSIVAYEVP